MYYLVFQLWAKISTTYILFFCYLLTFGFSFANMYIYLFWDRSYYVAQAGPNLPTAQAIPYVQSFVFGNNSFENLN